MSTIGKGAKEPQSGSESLPLRHLTATCENPGKTWGAASHRIRRWRPAVENRQIVKICLKLPSFGASWKRSNP
ncbi:hypothetical protein ACVISU_004940 [Bradyrhizobium sp. USDA 4452]